MDPPSRSPFPHRKPDPVCQRRARRMCNRRSSSRTSCNQKRPYKPNFPLRRGVRRSRETRLLRHRWQLLRWDCLPPSADRGSPVRRHRACWCRPISRRLRCRWRRRRPDSPRRLREELPERHRRLSRTPRGPWRAARRGRTCTLASAVCIGDTRGCVAAATRPSPDSLSHASTPRGQRGNAP